MASKYAIVMQVSVLAFLMAGLSMAAESREKGSVPVAAGGGSIQGALFNSASEGDATFSFFAGYDSRGEPTGSFMMKRVYPGHGVRAVVSTEVTDVELGFDDCPYVTMAGRTTLHAWWVDYPQERREYFVLKAWDCDGINDLSDKVWFGVYRDLGNPDADPFIWPDDCPNDRPALTLFFDLPEEPDCGPVSLIPAELTHGNINIPY